MFIPSLAHDVIRMLYCNVPYIVGVHPTVFDLVTDLPNNVVRVFLDQGRVELEPGSVVPLPEWWFAKLHGKTMEYKTSATMAKKKSSKAGSRTLLRNHSTSKANKANNALESARKDETGRVEMRAVRETLEEQGRRQDSLNLNEVDVGSDGNGGKETTNQRRLLEDAARTLQQNYMHFFVTLFYRVPLFLRRDRKRPFALDRFLDNVRLEDRVFTHSFVRTESFRHFIVTRARLGRWPLAPEFTFERQTSEMLCQEIETLEKQEKATKQLELQVRIGLSARFKTSMLSTLEQGLLRIISRKSQKKFELQLAQGSCRVVLPPFDPEGGPYYFDLHIIPIGQIASNRLTFRCVTLDIRKQAIDMVQARLLPKSLRARFQAQVNTCEAAQFQPKESKTPTRGNVQKNRGVSVADQLANMPKGLTTNPSPDAKALESVKIHKTDADILFSGSS